MKFREYFTPVQLLDVLRMWPTLIVAAITFAIVYAIAPQQVGILVYTLAKLSMAGYLGYWLDRWINPTDRPSAPNPDNVADDPIAAQYRRAAIVCATIIASGLMS